MSANDYDYDYQDSVPGHVFTISESQGKTLGLVSGDYAMLKGKRRTETVAEVVVSDDEDTTHEGILYHIMIIIIA